MRRSLQARLRAAIDTDAIRASLDALCLASGDAVPHELWSSLARRSVELRAGERARFDDHPRVSSGGVDLVVARPASCAICRQ
jgi:hypothetical protein